MKKECTSPYFAKPCDISKGIEGCGLNTQLQHQALYGGQKNPEKDGEYNGPYWSKGKWGFYMKNLEKAANKGCACAQELLKNAASITNEKSDRGEIA